jgi:tail protein
MAPPSTMTDYTYCYKDTGFVLNTDFNNTFPFFDVTDVSGLDSAPPRVTTNERSQQDGTYMDAQFTSGRTIVITGDMYTKSGDPETALMQLKRDYGAGSGVNPFYFQIPGQTMKFINCIGGGCKYDHDTNRSIGKTSGVQLTLLASDPYIYDYPGQAVGIQIPTTVTGIGMGFNMGFNLGFGGSLVGNAASVSNVGTHTAYPIITLYGPLVNPVIVDGYTGYTMAFGISLQANDALTIDCRNRSVVLNGTASRRSTLQGNQWPYLPAGYSTSIQFYADSGAGSALVQLYNTYY